MPLLAEFDRIHIRMYHRDHNPPHFHVRYAEFEEAITIDTLETLGGHLPSRIRERVEVWAAEHRDELAVSWERRGTAELRRIDR